MRLAPLPLILAALAVLVPSASHATRGVACHCYRERVYDPDAPASADAYILATTRSSLVSAALGPTKASLVGAVMTGAAPDDLLIAHWTAAKAGRFASELLDLKRARRTWRAALDGIATKDDAFQAALARGASDAELAGSVVDDLLVHRLHVDPAVVRELRGAGATSEEAIVAVVFGATRQTPAPAALGRVKSGQATWGSLLHDAGIEPDAIDGLVRQLVR
jgi:hypothetical protein